MRVTYNKKQVIRYLLWTFGIAYIIQIAAAIVYLHVNLTIGQLIIAAMMFVPMLSVRLSVSARVAVAAPLYRYRCRIVFSGLSVAP